MQGWGRVLVLTGFGIAVAAGCGGRTDGLESDFDPDPDEGGSSLGGKSAVAGKSGKAGAGIRGGAPAGGRPNVAGSGPVPVAGYSAGGYAGYGGYSYGGYGGYNYGGYAGYSYGGYAGYSYGGYAGYAQGGYAGSFAGAYPIGGYGGAGQAGCLSCLTNACSPQLLHCFLDAGCVSIFSCVEQTRCDALRCSTEPYCKGVIDQAGGPAGPSMQALLQTLACGVSAACDCN
jgi:hypothetical protein